VTERKEPCSDNDPKGQELADLDADFERDDPDHERSAVRQVDALKTCGEAEPMDEPEGEDRDRRRPPAFGTAAQDSPTDVGDASGDQNVHCVRIELPASPGGEQERAAVARMKSEISFADSLMSRASRTIPAMKSRWSQPPTM